MIDIPLLGDEYQEAFLNLLDEMDGIKSCSDNNKARYPMNEERLEEAGHIP